jgi:hypothetical protein
MKPDTKKPDTKPKHDNNAPVTITLRKPVARGSETITAITIRPLKGKYLRQLNEDENNIVNALNFASYLSGEPSGVIDELEGDDLRDVVKAVNDFFAAFRGTGPT